MSIEFIDLNITIPDFQKPAITLPPINTLPMPSAPSKPSLSMQDISDYNHNIEAFLRDMITDFQSAIDNTIASLKEYISDELASETYAVLANFKIELYKLQEKYYSQVRELRDKTGAASNGIPSGSMFYVYSKLLESSIVEIWSLYIEAQRRLIDVVKRGLASAFDKLSMIFRLRDQLSDEMTRVLNRVKELDFAKQAAIISNVVDYHNTLIDLYTSYAEAAVLVYTAQLSSLFEAEAKARKILADINTAEVDNTTKTLAEEIVLLNIEKNILNQRFVSLQMYEDIKSLEEYEAVLSNYNADIRRFAAEVDRAFMPYRIFSRKADAAEALISSQRQIAEADRLKIGTARLVMDADFDKKAADYSAIEGEISKLRNEIAKKEAEIRKAIDRAEAQLDSEYFSKLSAFVEELKNEESAWIERIANNEKAMRTISITNDLANKLYKLTARRDAVTAMRVDASNLLGIIDKAGEITRAGVIGCSQVTAEIVRSFSA